MFRIRRRQETLSSPTAQRGAVGSARVWDERTRADRAGPLGARGAPTAPGEEGFSALELAGLVRAVVHTTLEARLPDSPDEQRTTLARELELRLLELFAPRVAPAPEAMFPQPASPAQHTPPHAERARHEPPAAAAAPTLEPRARLLDLALEDRLGQLGSTTAARADLRDRLVALALERLACAAPEPNASPDDLRTLDVLQRRTAKLEQALAEARAALAYVAGLEYVDPGEPSLYRSVQGLAPEDPRRAQKGAVLECLFQANLSLQKPGA